MELEAVEDIVKEFEYQLINFLKAMNVEIGLFHNFGTKSDLRRKVLTNDRKNFADLVLIAK